MLPLRIAAVGPLSRLVARRLSNQYPKGAFSITVPEVVEELKADLPPHILIADPKELATIQSAYLRLVSPAEGLPALIVSSGSHGFALRAAARLPSGAALAVAPRADFRWFLTRLLEAIGADQPLEHAVWRAARRVYCRPVWLGPEQRAWPDPERTSSVVLVSDPYVNQALRMKDAAEMLRQEFDLRGLKSPELTPRLDKLAEARTQLATGPAVTTWAPSVDVVILRGIYRNDRDRALEPGTTLQAGQHYFIQVHVGNPLPASIVQRADLETRSAVRSGPSAGSQLLEVVLQPKDFALRSPNRRFLYLQPSGASTRVRFGVTAPEKYGQSRMRVAVFCGNLMLQTVEIQVAVADREYTSSAREAGAVADLEFNHVEDLSGVASLPSRILTISVNRDASAHSLLLKSSNDASGIDLPDSKVTRVLERYRNILLNATYKKPTEPRFPETHTEPNDDSREYIRELAELGRDMYQELYDPDNDERLAVFRKMLASNNQVVSIIRHDFEFAWPWAIMYDFPLPRNLLGRTPRVCFGFDNGQECGHRGQEAVCCVRGFWGYRHQIEELYGGRMKRARINSVKIAPGPAIGYIGSTGTSYEEKMKTDLKALGSATAIQPDKFLDTLWDQSQRPAVVVVLGHMETRDLTNEPTGPRIVLGSSGGDAPAMCWLRSTEVMDYVQRNPWPRPESIVILLSCGSGGITPATLSNLVLSFLKANASAVVGTECDVWTQLLARWGTELAQGMIRDHQSLGETVTAGRRRLLQQGIPLAFVFNSVGVADLRLEP